MLPAVRDNLDGLSDELKGHYAPGADDSDFKGKFVLDVDAVSGLQLAPVTQLKNALTAARGERDKFEGDLKKFTIDGTPLDITAALAAIERVKQFDEGLDPDTKEQLKALKESLESQYLAKEQTTATKYAQDFENLNGTNAKLKQQLHGAILHTKVSTLLGSEDYKGNAVLLMPHIESKAMAVDNEDGSISYKVRGPEGQARMSNKSGSTADMTIEELVAEMAKDPNFASCFSGKLSSGTGAVGGGGAGGQGGDRSLEGLNPVERMKQARKSA